MSDDDEWETADVPTGLLGSASAIIKEPSKHTEDDDDDNWDIPVATPKETTEKEESRGEPMLLVDLTKLTDGKIHCKFDAHAVNDPQAVSDWRKTAHYPDLVSDTELVATGVIVPCGSSVWRPALQRLKKERPGNYIVPVFSNVKK